MGLKVAVNKRQSLMRGGTKGLDIILDEEEDQDQDGDPSQDTSEARHKKLGNQSICFFGDEGILEEYEESESHQQS